MSSSDLDHILASTGLTFRSFMLSVLCCLTELIRTVTAQWVDPLQGRCVLQEPWNCSSSWFNNPTEVESDGALTSLSPYTPVKKFITDKLSVSLWIKFGAGQFFLLLGVKKENDSAAFIPINYTQENWPPVPDMTFDPR